MAVPFEQLNPNGAFWFGAFRAWVIVGEDVRGSGNLVITVREIGTNDLLAHTTDIQDIARRLTPLS